MSDTILDVLVVGAGPSGLVLAAELARHGLSCRIIDRDRTPSDKSRALAIQARTLELFDLMGIVDKFTARGVQVHGLSMHTGSHRIAHFSFDDLDSPYSYILMLRQPETERILGDYLVARGPLIERQVELITFEQDEEGITSRLRHPNGREETVRSRWLAGCDGAHSAVRQALGLPFEGSDYPDRFLLADVHVTWQYPDEEANVFIAENGLLAVMPLGGGRYRLIANNPVELGELDETAQPTLEQCQALVEARGPGGVILSDASWIALFYIHRRIAPQMRVRRAFLVGDASHIHSPAGGQGMNTGIQDAYNLAWKLALATQGKAPTILLDSYHIERHPVDEAVLRSTDFFTKILSTRNPVLRFLRDHLAPVVVATAQEYVRSNLSELSINYCESPIVEENELSSGPTAGERAPDVAFGQAANASPTRLFGLLRATRHTLLLLAGSAESNENVQTLAYICNQVAELYPELINVHLVLPGAIVPEHFAWHGSILLDSEGKLHARYGGGDACLYLIRPDGYIGFRGPLHVQAELFAYLRSLFSITP